MFKRNESTGKVGLALSTVAILAAVSMLHVGSTSADEIPPRAAYVYLSNETAAAQYVDLLAEDGIETALIPRDHVTETDWTVFDLILIGPDTGGDDSWSDLDAVRMINESAVPIMALGEGGTDFLRRLDRAPASPSLNEGRILHVTDPEAPVYSVPHPIAVPGDRMLTLFNDDTPVSYAHLPERRSDLYKLGRHPDDDVLYSFLLHDGRYTFWGYDGPPAEMTDTGRDLFANAADHALGFAGNVDALILTNYQRMIDIGYTFSSVSDLANRIYELSTLPPNQSKMVATSRDLTVDAPDYVKNGYAAWNGHEADIAKTNVLAAAIRKYIRTLRKGPFCNLKYVILVGAHEVIPMEARKVPQLHKDASEAEWAEQKHNLPQKSGYLYEIYANTTDSPNGYFLSDLAYRNWSYTPGAVSGYPGKWLSDEYLPELGVGRLVETPNQIKGVIDAYIARRGNLSRTNMTVVASKDFTKTGGLVAQYMGPSADTSLVKDCADFKEGEGNCFPSSLVPPKLNAKHDVVCLAGHGSHNLLTTQKWHHAFLAGNDPTQGDTTELNPMPGAAIASAGSCHLGLNLGNRLYHEPGNDTTYADFAEEFAAKQVGVFLGDTSLAFGQELGADFIDELLNSGHTQTAGLAHVDAIDNYMFDHGPHGGSYDPSEELWHQQTLASSTLYGMPTYGWPVPFVTKKGLDFGLEKISFCQNCPFDLKDQITWKLRDWARLPDGRVLIEGARYGSGGVDLPILPRVRHSRVLPLGSTVAEIEWDESASTFVTITNDVPLDTASWVNYMLDGVETRGSGVFDHDGFYPPEPFGWTVSPGPGGSAVRVELVIAPVQYNPATHETRIWTRLALDVFYAPDADRATTDGDGDELPDYWEAGYGLGRYSREGQHGLEGDPDGDGLRNWAEHDLGTDPGDVDSDRDGLTDGEEDSNGNGSIDEGETSPVSSDTDGDAYIDGDEVLRGSDPLNPESAPVYIEAALLEGPRQVGISLPSATTHVFKISYSNPDQTTPVRIEETVPAEFEMMSANASVGEVVFFKTSKSSKGKAGGANRLEWDLSDGQRVGTLVVEIRTVESPGRGHEEAVFKPTSCGPLAINDGATAFEVDPATGKIVEVDVQDPETGEVRSEPVIVLGPSNSLRTEAVEGAKSCE